MPVQSPQQFLQVEQINDVTVARFTQKSILEEAMADEIGKQLLSLVKEHGCRRLVLNCELVERLATVVVGKIVGIHRALKADGGRLAVCRINPPVKEIFRILNLYKLLNIYDDEQQALESF